MLKAIFRFASVALMSHLGIVMAQPSTEPLPEAIEVLERSVSTGNLNFVVGAVGNADGQIWSHAAGFQDAEKTSLRLPITLFKLPQ